MDRCYRKWCHAYPRYGGRGINVCGRWHKFENFEKDMGPMPEGLTLERIKNHRGYSKCNCKWATREEQNKNKRTVSRLAYRGRTYTIPDLAKKLAMSDLVLRYRIRKGWPVKLAVSLPRYTHIKGALRA